MKTKAQKIIVGYTIIKEYDEYRNGGIETNQVAICSAVPKLYNNIMQRLSELNENREVTEEYKLHIEYKRVKEVDINRQWKADYQVPSDARAVIVTSKCGDNLIDEKGYYYNGVWKRVSDDTELGNVVVWRLNVQ